jgi:hypothetical protein
MPLPALIPAITAGVNLVSNLVGGRGGGGAGAGGASNVDPAAAADFAKATSEAAAAETLLDKARTDKISAEIAKANNSSRLMQQAAS